MKNNKKQYIMLLDALCRTYFFEHEEDWYVPSSAVFQFYRHVTVGNKTRYAPGVHNVMTGKSLVKHGLFFSGPTKTFKYRIHYFRLPITNNIETRKHYLDYYFQLYNRRPWDVKPLNTRYRGFGTADFLQDVIIHTLNTPDVLQPIPRHYMIKNASREIARSLIQKGLVTMPEGETITKYPYAFAGKQQAYAAFTKQLFALPLFQRLFPAMYDRYKACKKTTNGIPLDEDLVEETMAAYYPTTLYRLQPTPQVNQPTAPIFENNPFTIPPENIS